VKDIGKESKGGNRRQLKSIGLGFSPFFLKEKKELALAKCL